MEIPTDKDRIENKVSEGILDNGRLTYRDVLLEGQRNTRKQQDKKTDVQRIDKNIEWALYAHSIDRIQ